MQPFQVIKIRLANQSLKSPEYLGIVDCIRKIHFKQGLSTFYKGTLSPLLGVGPQVALQFASNQFIRKLLLKIQNNGESSPGSNIYMYFASGFLSGIPSAIVATPVDLTRIQLQKKGGCKQFNGSIDAAKKIYHKNGLSGLYLGFHSTLLRQIIALSFYFGVYEKGMRLLDPNGKNSSNAPLQAAFFVGGFAGTASWVLTYPIDYVKTLVQSQSMKNKDFTTATKYMHMKYRQEGIKTFYKGLGVTILRSFPVNGSGFLIFESLMRMAGRKNNQNKSVQNQNV